MSTLAPSQTTLSTNEVIATLVAHAIIEKLLEGKPFRRQEFDFDSPELEIQVSESIAGPRYVITVHNDPYIRTIEVSLTQHCVDGRPFLGFSCVVFSVDVRSMPVDESAETLTHMGHGVIGRKLDVLVEQLR
jgi:hypothetical protein